MDKEKILSDLNTVAAQLVNGVDIVPFHLSKGKEWRLTFWMPLRHKIVVSERIDHIVRALGYQFTKVDFDIVGHRNEVNVYLWFLDEASHE